MTGNIVDYLEWYGDFDFKVLPFNEVDNLILAEVSYVNFENIVPGPHIRGYITVKEAADYVKNHNLLKDCCRLEQNAGAVLMAMAAGRRFANAHLSAYVNKHDFENQEQFAALHIKLDDGTMYIAYTGTDDTILGWKEDLNMAYQMPVPAQKEAVHYINTTINPHGLRKLRVGGHSKGGNLAIYAAVKCDPRIRKRMIQIFNNDGPGFLSEMVESKEYQEILDRIETIVPETSIIGMLLEHHEKYKVVKSSQKGILQHEALNWHVYRNSFVELDERSRDSLLIDHTVTNWIDALTKEQRAKFIDTIYDLLTKADIHFLSDFETYSAKKMNILIKEMLGLDGETKKMIKQIIKELAREYGRAVKEIRIAQKQQMQYNNEIK